MHPRTEDLLTLRDGDPADADTLARLRAVPGAPFAVARLERMRDALRALPELEAPVGAWEAIEARLAAPASSAARGVTRSALPARVFGSAAAIVLTVIAVLGASMIPPPTSEAPDRRAAAPEGGAAAGSEWLGDSLRAVAEGFDRTVEVPVVGDGVAERYASLARQSAALEQVLGAISFQRPVMSGATASAIAGLEDRVARIDAVMTSTALPAEVETTLLRVRVDLLAALVDLRLAQADQIPF